MRVLTATLAASLLLLAGGRAMAQSAPAQKEADFEPLPAMSAPSPAPQTPAFDEPPDLSSFVNQRITRVEIVTAESGATGAASTASTASPKDQPTLKSIKVGDPLSAPLVRSALAELLATGAYARASATVTQDRPALGVSPAIAGVRLTIHVARRQLISKLSIETHDAPVDKEELLRQLGLTDGGEIVPASITEQRGRARQWLAAQGYPNADVAIQTRPTDDPMRTVVLVDVQAGTPLLIEQRFFYVFGTARENLESLFGDYQLDVDERMDEQAARVADTELEAKVRARGFHTATVVHDVGKSRGKITLRVRIDAGPLFEPRFEGNNSYDADALSGALNLEEDTDRSSTHLTDKIRTFYVKRGFNDVEVTLTVRGQVTDPIRHIVFRIIEHRRAVVVSRKYPCLKTQELDHVDTAPSSPAAIGSEIDSFLEEELPGADVLRNPDPSGVDALTRGTPANPTRGERAEPIDLDPHGTYVRDTYDRAVQHVQELYRNEGFLHAIVGPTQAIRAQCDPKSPAGQCIPLPLPSVPVNQCTYDATNVPLAVPPLDPSFTCVPDPPHNIACASRVDLLIPIKLGPKTMLYDASFTGARSLSEQRIARAADLPMGKPVNRLQLDDASRRIADLYKDEGYPYVEVKYSLEESLDHTHARVKFEIFEGEQVIVSEIIIRGIENTHESVVRRRVALKVGEPYRARLVTRTQERIATLGVFSTVNVALEDPYVPQKRKAVIITLNELIPQSFEVKPGFATGEGFRGAVEYSHRNLFGYAVSLTGRLQMSYLPDPLIFDQQVRENLTGCSGCQPPLRGLSIQERIVYRATLTLGFPEVGLGPLVRGQTDFVLTHDLFRDFLLTKRSFFGNLIVRPSRELQLSVGPGIEFNRIEIFRADSVRALLDQDVYKNSPDLSRLLRVPDGDSTVVSARFVASWDRRDSAFNAKRGTLAISGIEFVNSYKTDPVHVCSQQDVEQNSCPPQVLEAHFFRLTERVGGYLPITRNVTFAAELRLGHNLHPFKRSGSTDIDTTYPDRLFFMGGIDSMRGWLLDSFTPYEDVELLRKNGNATPSNIAVRGGNLMINPRFELRFPIKEPLETALFADFGNLWRDPSNVYDLPFKLRSAVGTGLRLQTPIGPLVLDGGFNLARAPGEAPYAIHFAIGVF